MLNAMIKDMCCFDTMIRLHRWRNLYYKPLYLHRFNFLIVATVSLFLFGILNLAYNSYVFNRRWMGSSECWSQKIRQEHLMSESLPNFHILPSLPVACQACTEKAKDEKRKEAGDCISVTLSSRQEKVKICIHDPQIDRIISARLKNSGSWEKGDVDEMLKAVKAFPELTLLDLGCNIGVFTIAAASAGIKVVAVDALLDNLQLLQRSLSLNNLSCSVTLVHNAVHRKRGRLQIIAGQGNVGGSSVAEISPLTGAPLKSSQVVDAICLNDLVPLLQGKNVFLKVDLEGSEVPLLECAEDFFNQVNVQVILIEWINYRNNDAGSTAIKNFLLSHGMIPTWGVDREWVVDPLTSNGWPDNVYWMKE